MKRNRLRLPTPLVTGKLTRCYLGWSRSKFPQTIRICHIWH